MRAIVISGGGSKGAFAGGVAQYLIERQQRDYDLFVGTSTGSLLLIHLARTIRSYSTHQLVGAILRTIYIQCRLITYG